MSKQITKLVAQIWDRTWATLTSLTPTKKQPAPTYSFLEDPIDDTTHIVINDGLAAGVVFRYGRVRFAEGVGQLNIKFGYQVVRNTEQLTDTVLKPIIVSILDDILYKDIHGQD